VGGSDNRPERGTAAGAADAYRAEIGSDPAEVEAVRTAVRRLAAEGRFADRAQDLELALAEIVANAQEHGLPPVRVRAWLDGRLVVEVTDAGEGFDADTRVPDRPPSHGGHRGRGLWIARQLVDVMDVRASPDGTTVRLELSPEPHIGA
jgi:anti-sigma regulatory factor (Ser/Thr protein kinase)